MSKYPGNGSLKLTSANSRVDEVVLPISSILSACADQRPDHRADQYSDQHARHAEDSKQPKVDAESEEEDTLLSIVHVQRSKEIFYRQRVQTSLLKFAAKKQFDSVFQAVTKGLLSVTGKRPTRILVNLFITASVSG